VSAQRLEIREHHVFQVHGFQNRLENCRTLFKLRSNQQEEAQHYQPRAVRVSTLEKQEHPDHDHQRCERVRD